MAELLAWLRTRVVQWRIALLWLALAAAVIAAGACEPRAWTLAVAAALLVQYRLWDDLEDLPHDRTRAPERVLVRCTELLPFRLALGVSFGLVATLLAWQRTVAYLLLLAALAAVYRATAASAALRSLRVNLVLLKYPAFVLLLSIDPATPRALAAATVLYVVLVVHEWRDARAG